jgi:hypothetical protein
MDKKQKFHHGDVVLVNASHQTAEFTAIVKASYADLHARKSRFGNDEYAICELKGGKCISEGAWYPERQLTLVRAGDNFSFKQIRDYLYG